MHSPVCPARPTSLLWYEEQVQRERKQWEEATGLSLGLGRFIGHVIMVESGHSLERQSHPVPSLSSKGFRNNTPNN